jgi:hypothetical protein
MSSASCYVFLNAGPVVVCIMLGPNHEIARLMRRRCRIFKSKFDNYSCQPVRAHLIGDLRETLKPYLIGTLQALKGSFKKGQMPDIQCYGP